METEENKGTLQILHRKTLEQTIAGFDNKNWILYTIAKDNCHVLDLFYLNLRIQSDK